MNFDIIWLLGKGIGNVIEALYSIEYCLSLNKKCGVCLEDIPSSFVEYLRKCYPDLIIENESSASCENVIHSWLYEKPITVRYKNYLYINPNQQSVEYTSEDESYLNLVKSIYPTKDEGNTHLTSLIESKPTRFISDQEIESKYVIYFGSSALSPVKRWPYFNDLIKLLKKENVLVVGGRDDMNFQYSYRYPTILRKFLGKKITNQIRLWRLLKSMKLLIPHAHFDTSKLTERVFINVFSWEELVYIFRRAKGYVGNDGGLSHLASAANVKAGITIFGPSSIKKNKPFNTNIKSISKNMPCQPCYFSPTGIHMGKNYINCPYGVKCLDQIKPETVNAELLKIT